MPTRALRGLAVMVSCLTLSACGSLVSSTGRLNGHAIKRLDVEIPSGTPRCPGSSFQVQIKATDGDGVVVDTAHGIRWGNFDTEVQGGTVTPQGRVQLSADPRLTWRRAARFRASLISHASVSTVVAIPVSYRCQYRAHLGTQKAPQRLLNIQAAVRLIGTRAGEPIAEVRITARDTGRAGTFYLSPGGSLTLHHGLESSWPGTLSIYTQAAAAPFVKAIRLAQPGGVAPRVFIGDPPRSGAQDLGPKAPRHGK